MCSATNRKQIIHFNIRNMLGIEEPGPSFSVSLIAIFVRRALLCLRGRVVTYLGCRIGSDGIGWDREGAVSGVRREVVE